MKQKTIKSARKRIIKITKRGKLLRRRLSAQHLAVGKSKRTLRSAGKKSTVSSADRKKIKRLIPYR